MGRGLLIWFVIMLVETLHGALRGALVVPRIGATAAERVGWPVAAVLVLVISVLLIRWTGIRGTAPLLRLGAQVVAHERPVFGATGAVREEFGSVRGKIDELWRVSGR